ncbi:WxL protein host-binding domain-containing protein, partial [Lactiplantibacillus plantarum]|uniref:WxL protein host-binding domain-containing protein n=1 Tax=Lactiplantibacillus plantarum TaxID=1590 RepID=UPI003C1A2588
VHSWGMPPVMFSVVTKYHKGRHSLFLYNSEIFYAFTQDILRSHRLQAGSYHVRLVAKNTDHRWVFDKDFVISTAAADKYNQASVDDSGMSVGWFILFGALGMLIIGLIGLLIFFWIKKRRRA